jgi:MFS transporter, MHS family, proline/betaine transporter
MGDLAVPALATSRPVKANTARIVTAAAIGSGFEIYDFTLFAFFAVSIAPAFFPAGDSNTSVLMTVATFGIGAIMRPIGALVLGIYGDRLGRKTVLSATIVTMAAGSVAIGLIPRYQTIGLWAPVLVVLARMVQGVSAGGEMGTSLTFVAEQVPANRRGFYMGIVNAASLLGTLLSASLGLLLSHLLAAAAMSEWGWRIPFLIGGLFGPVGFYVRSRLPESEEFLESRAAAKSPTAAAAATAPRLNPRILLCIMAGIIPGSVINYLTLVYMPTFLHQQLGVMLDVSFSAVLLASIAVSILFPLGGALSDRIGRRGLVLGGNLALLACSYPLYRALQASPTLATILGVILAFTVLLTLVTSPMMPLAAETLPTIGRSTGMSLGLALPIALLGASSPLLVSLLILLTGNSLAPAFYLMASGVAGFIGVALLPRRGTDPDRRQLE